MRYGRIRIMIRIRFVLATNRNIAERVSICRELAIENNVLRFFLHRKKRTGSSLLSSYQIQRIQSKKPVDNPGVCCIITREAPLLLWIMQNGGRSMPRNAEKDLREESRRRAQILEAGLALFSAQGIESVSMNAVAAAAGVGPTTLFKYYQGKAGRCHQCGGMEQRMGAGCRAVRHGKAHEFHRL